jgi:hypothetical protein
MKILSLSLILTCLGLSTVSAKPQCCINKEACCLTKEKCCEDERKPHGRKPHIDWKAKKAEFLKKFDKDGDGKISPEEKKAVIKEWKKHGHKRPEGRKPRVDRKKRPAKKGGQ